MISSKGCPVGCGLLDPASNARKTFLLSANNVCLTKLVNCVKSSLIAILKKRHHMSLSEKRLSLADSSINNNNRPEARKRHCYFTLCSNCLWCASVFEARLAEPPAEKYFCPNCHFKVELMPLADREVYRLEFSKSGGLELEFSR